MQLLFIFSLCILTIMADVQLFDEVEVEDISSHNSTSSRSSSQEYDESDNNIIHGDIRPEGLKRKEVQVKRAIEDHVYIDKNNIEKEVKAELDKAVHSLKETAKEKEEEAHGVISGVAKMTPRKETSIATRQAVINMRENGMRGTEIVMNLEPCSAVDCNNRGTCLGSKTTFICACQLGYSGKHCEETVCDSSRDCNGRGICLGTTNQLTCLCNLGFTGRRCETPI